MKRIKKPILSGLILCGCLVFQAGCQALNPITGLRLHLDKEKPFVIVTSSKNAWGFATHPWVVCASTNEIGVAFNTGGDGGGAPIPDDLVGMHPAFSTNGGQTWLYGELADEAFSRSQCYDFPLSDGGFAPKPWKGVGNMHSFHLSPSQGVEMPDGSILMCGFGKQQSGDSRFSAVVARSVDRGQSYHLHSVVATIDDVPGRDGAGPNEIAMVRLNNGEFLCMIRALGGSGSGTDTSGSMLKARSRDDGKTWEKSPFLIGGVMPKLYQLSNGILVLAFGRPGNNLIFSTDNGNTWGSEIAMTSPSTKTSGYIDLVEVEPGRIFVVYDTFGRSAQKVWLFTPPQPLNIVWGCYVNISKLF